MNVCVKDGDVTSDLRRALSESEKRNEEINREFQKLLRQKEVIMIEQICVYMLVSFILYTEQDVDCANIV